jgi:elongation factor Tu
VTQANVALAVLGAAGHGRTHFSAALAARAATRSGGEAPSLRAVETGIPDDWAHYVEEVGTRYIAGTVRLQTSRLFLTLHDSPTHARVLDRLLSNHPAVDLAFLIVAADVGVTAEAGEQVLLAAALGLPLVAVVLTRADLAAEPEWLDLIEAEARQLLHEGGLPGDDLPVVRVNSLSVYESRGQDRPECRPFDELLTALDALPAGMLPAAGLARAWPLGVRVVGRIGDRVELSADVRCDRGVIRAGDRLEVLGWGPAPQAAEVLAVYPHTSTRDQVQAGEQTRLLLAGSIAAPSERPGGVLVAEGSYRPATVIEAVVRQFGTARWRTPLFPGPVYTIAVETGPRPGRVITLQSLTGEALGTAGPGELAVARWEFAPDPHARLAAGQRFTFAEAGGDGEPVGSGVVARLLG